MDKKITHVVHYMIADNELDISAIRDIGKLMFSHAEHSFTPDQNVKERHCVFDLLIKTKINVVFIHISNQVFIQEVKMKDLNSFYSLPFLQKTFRRFILLDPKYKFKPQTNKVFIVSGHGSGWYMHGGPDEHTERQVLHINHIREALEYNNLVLDIICLDGCFSAGIEIIYELMNVVKYMVASQEYMYWEGISSMEFCRFFIEPGDLWTKTNKLAEDFVVRSEYKKEPTCLTVIDVRKFRPIMIEALKLTYRAEDFDPRYIIDTCEIWLTDCPTCDELECNIFYDFQKIVERKLSVNKRTEFARDYGRCVKMYKGKYFNKELLATGINFAQAYRDVKLIKKPIFRRTYEKLKIYTHHL